MWHVEDARCNRRVGLPMSGFFLTEFSSGPRYDPTSKGGLSDGNDGLDFDRRDVSPDRLLTSATGVDLP